MPLLSLNNLQISFPNSAQKAVKGLSFAMPKGSTLGIVGESGSGKSLTGLAIMGLLPFEAKITGEILYSAENKTTNLLAISESEKRKLRGSKIAMIFQEPMTALNPVMRCGRQVEEILELHSQLSAIEQKTRVIELFSEVKLPSPEITYSKYPHQLSGGQRQRVMIAMAIACNPQLLIADEPTTALDVTVQAEILKLLATLQKKHNLSMIFISHDLNVISQVSDNVLVMKQGELIELGTAKDILNNPQQPYTQGLISCKPKANKRPIKLPVVEDFLSKEVINIQYITKEERTSFHEKIYNTTPILEIRNINAFFDILSGSFIGHKKQFQALRNINMQIWKGETVGFVGESGSGKSTLGRTIMRLIENTQGEVLVNGIDISKLSKDDLKQYRRTVQLVFQDPYSSLCPHHSIGYSIMEPMIVHKTYENSSKRKERTCELMEMCGLQRAWFDKFPHQLSGGQRQRVVIARALALDPEIVICDESVSALDVSIQAQILNLLNDLKRRLGLTYIFISHDLAVVKFMSDRIFVLRNGQIQESGEADELYENPQSEYTKGLIQAAFQ